MTLEAIIFGGMGSVAECAELDRSAWNASFRSHGVDWNWSWDTYAELMRAGGDRQPATHYGLWRAEMSPVQPALLDDTHQKRFASMLTGSLPLRPGVGRTLGWLARAGVKLGFVSRAGAIPVRALLTATARERAGIGFDVAVLREDVTHLAPHPEAMTAAIDALDVRREQVAVVADTPASAQAAQEAGLAVLAFPGALSAQTPEDFGSLPMVKVLSPEVLTSAWRGGLETAAQ
jgi:beta-phosphoglucomutase-like phosphatase (HAD superfamily)